MLALQVISGFYFCKIKAFIVLNFKFQFYTAKVKIVDQKEFRSIADYTEFKVNLS